MRKDLILLSVLILVFVIFASSYTLNTPTGFALVEGGGTTAIGTKSIANPTTGVIYGNIVWEIREGDTVITSDVPEEAIDVYFVPSGNEVNWDGEIVCDSPINGNLNHIDADGEGTACSEINYRTPTGYRCTTEDINGESLMIYKTISTRWNQNVSAVGMRIRCGWHTTPPIM